MKTKPLFLIAIIASLLTCAPQFVSARSSIPTPMTDVSLSKAISDAEKVAQSNPNWCVMLADGFSMAPHYGANSVLIIDQTNFRQLEAGMIVVYRDQEGDLVGHQLLARTADGWTAQGVNNPGEDPELVTPSNFRGVIFGVLNTRGADAMGLRIAQQKGLPRVIGKTY
ncbi:MAG: hypothetical protein ACQKBV_13340 [Puniceicoccales bacterium]